MRRLSLKDSLYSLSLYITCLKRILYLNLDLENAFEILKNKLIKSSIVAIYDAKAYTELHCDVNAQGFGVILM